MLTLLTNRVATLALVLTPTTALCTAVASAAIPAAPLQQQGSAKDCMTPVISNGHNALRNDCGQVVELFWCQVGSDCDGDHGWVTTVGTNVSWTIGENVRWGACYGRNSGGFDRGTSGTSFSCE